MAVFLLDLNSWRQIIYVYIVRAAYLKKIQFGANGLHSIRSILCCWYGMIPKNSDTYSLIVHLFRNYVTWLLDVNKVTTSSMNIDDDQQMKGKQVLRLTPLKKEAAKMRRYWWKRSRNHKYVFR